MPSGTLGSCALRVLAEHAGSWLASRLAREEGHPIIQRLDIIDQISSEFRSEIRSEISYIRSEERERKTKARAFELLIAVGM